MNRFRVPVSLCALLLAAAANSATFTVTNTNDSGNGSLRQAILDGVAATVGNVAHDTVIAFNIPGTGVHTIQPASPLPPIKDLLIDGFTQPGSRANTLAKGSDAIVLIEIDGINAGSGADGLVNEGTVPGAGVPFVGIRGLAINRFSGAGIRVSGPGGAGYPGYVTVQGCHIGTDASGTQARGNGVGILLENDGQALIGEVTPAFGGNVTPWPAYRNVISGNVGAGIAFASTDPSNPAVGTVRNAYVGTDASGLLALGNGGDGISISAESALGSQSFGSEIYLHDNVIAANQGDGIDTQGIGTQAVGNTIGSNVDGGALGNQGHGAYFHGNSIGALGAAFGQPGVPGPGVAHNAGAGVRIADNAIVDVGGPVYSNIGLGIDIGTSGPDANDAGDADTGPNERLNVPIVTTAAVANGVAGTHIQGTINTRPNSQLQVRLFANSSCNPAGYGESERMIDTGINVTTDGSGNGTFDKQLAFTLDPAVYPVVTAQTRRVAEGTYPIPTPILVSEFSACAPVTGGGPPPTLGINDVTVAEGNSGMGTATFTVTLSSPAISTVTVGYATANGTATAGSDYLGASGTLTFAAGQTTKSIAVTIVGDTLIEADETFVVNLSSASGATIADAQGVATITNDDAPLPTLGINDVIVSEGNSGTSIATFTVTLSAASAAVVTVDYATANGTATAGSDYLGASGTLTFAAGQTTKSIAVTIVGDTTAETDETFVVNLSSASGATIADAQGVATITNDDAPLPTLGINDVTVSEGNSGTSTATFTVTLSAVSAAVVTVDYATANGTATAGSDYLGASGTLTFAAGQTTKSIAVTIVGDTSSEPDETFVVDLSAASGAAIADAQGVATITNDDAPLPTLGINDVTVGEGNSGTNTATFTVTLSAASAAVVTVDYATANGTATAGSDYLGASGTLTFAPGETTKTILVTIAGDTTTEPDETFVVNLSSASGATIADAQGAVTIANDDVVTPPPAGGGGGGSMDPGFLAALALASLLVARARLRSARSRNGMATRKGASSLG